MEVTTTLDSANQLQIPDPVKANAYDAVLGGSPYNVAIGLARTSDLYFVTWIVAIDRQESNARSAPPVVDCPV